MVFLSKFGCKLAADGTIRCKLSQQVDLDALNLLASGQNRSLCVCDYEEIENKHVFRYQLEQMQSLEQIGKGLQFDDVVSLLASFWVAASDQTLKLEHLQIFRESIFTDGTGFRFVYLPVAEHSPRGFRDTVLKIFGLLKLQNDCLSKLHRDLKQERDETKVKELLRGFLESFGGFPGDGEEETSLLDRSEEETSLLGYSDPSEAETGLLGMHASLTGEEETSLLGAYEPEQRLMHFGDQRLEEKNGYDFREHTGLSISRLTERVSSQYGSDETMLLDQAYEPERRRERLPCDENAMLFLLRCRNGERIHVNATPYTLGAEAQRADFVLAEPGISRVHATIEFLDSHYYITDERSTNGTVVEGIRLHAGERMEIGNGDFLSLGTEVFQVIIERR